MKILVFSDNYPSKIYPAVGTFVYKLVQKMSDGCNQLTVIAPQKLGIMTLFKSEKQYGLEKAEVRRPFYFSLSNRNIGGFNTYNIAKNTKKIAFKKAYQESLADIVYCHFLSNALIVAEALRDNQKPIIAAVGEYKNIDAVRKHYDKNQYNQLLERIDGYIAVSEQVKAKLIEIDVPETKIIVLPNATDLEVFKPREKTELRKSLNLPIDKKIVLFVGRFIPNKGPLVVLEALNRLNNENIVGVFIGKGIQEKEISGDKVVLKTSLTFDEVPLIMSAADIFVLPTHHEGSSNVIVEAMASGLPIISSDIPEIRVQCEKEFSNLVNYNDIEAVQKAITSIYNLDSQQYQEMSSSARKHAHHFDLDNRTKNVIEFCKKIVESKKIR